MVGWFIRDQCIGYTKGEDLGLLFPAGASAAVIVVQARLGSTRLPGKMLADLCGKPLIWHILRRARAVRAGLPVVLAIPATETDRKLGQVAAEEGVPVVAGPELDVMGRFLAVLDEFPASWVVRVCGDSPLFDPGHLDRCLRLAEAENADVVRFRGNPGTLLQGGEVVSARALRLSRREAPEDPLSREHVTAWALRHAPDRPDLVTAYIDPDPDLVLDKKLSIDTESDLERLRRLYGELWNGAGIIDLKSAAAWLRGPAGADW